MRKHLRRALSVAVIAGLTATMAAACGSRDEGGSSGDGGSGGTGGGGGTVTIGIKFDQPGLGLKNPDGSFSGFDVDVAKYVAKKLGYAEDKIEFKEAKSAPFTGPPLGGIPERDLL